LIVLLNALIFDIAYTIEKQVLAGTRKTEKINHLVLNYLDAN